MQSSKRLLEREPLFLLRTTGLFPHAVRYPDDCRCGRRVACAVHRFVSCRVSAATSLSGPFRPKLKRTVIGLDSRVLNVVRGVSVAQSIVGLTASQRSQRDPGCGITNIA